MPASTQAAAISIREALPAGLERLTIHYSGPLRLELGAREAALIRPAHWPLPAGWKRLGAGMLTLDEVPAVEGLCLELPTLDELSYGGWGQLVVEALQPLRRLRLRLQGAGRLRFSGQLEELEVEVAGSGTLLAAGWARRLRVRTSGSGEVQAQELQCQLAGLHIGGSGRCRVWVEEELHLQSRGCGEVAYSGWPRITSQGPQPARLVNVN